MSDYCGGESPAAMTDSLHSIISAGGFRGHDHAQSRRLQQDGEILDESEKVSR